MKKKYQLPLLTLVAGMLLPQLANCQTIAGEVQSLHTVLDNVYDQMLPLCGQVTNVAVAIGSFGALFYIGYRVWKHIANAEPIDFFPLFRPLVLCLLINMFGLVMGVINGILKPSVTATAAIVQNSNDAVTNLLAAREAAIKKTTEWQVLVGPTGSGDRQAWYQYTHPNAQGGEGFFESIGNDIKFFMAQFMYNLKFMFKYLISLILELIYYAASLTIDTIRTFHLIVLSILGPFVFGLSCYDGFQQSLTHWLARYVNIYMWLPVANLFGAILNQIQKNMLQIDLAQIQQTGTTSFTSTDGAYLIFMIIGILGYFTVPGVANYIVHAHGGNSLLSKTNSFTSNLFSLGGGSGSAVAQSQGGQSSGAGQSIASASQTPSDSFQSKKIQG